MSDVFAAAANADTPAPTQEPSRAELAATGRPFRFGDFNYNPGSQYLRHFDDGITLSPHLAAILLNIARNNGEASALLNQLRLAGSPSTRLVVVRQQIHRLKKKLEELSPGGGRHIAFVGKRYQLFDERTGLSPRKIKAGKRRRSS